MPPLRAGIRPPPLANVLPSARDQRSPVAPGCQPHCAPKLYVGLHLLLNFIQHCSSFSIECCSFSRKMAYSNSNLKARGEKRGERWDTHPPTACRASPTSAMGCPSPCPCPAARSAASAGSPARPPTRGNWQSSVAPNYTSWVPGPLTLRLRKVNLRSFRPA